MLGIMPEQGIPLFELNYTPENEDGIIDPKAISAESFEVSRQFWSYLVQENKICTRKFHQEFPHMSFVWEVKM
jgi:malate dehydrogenase (quinone)